jgi:hypothetical protein
VSDRYQIKITKWDKFNPRSDRSNFSWFRMQNDFFINQSVFALTNFEKLLFVFVACEASKKNNSDVELLTEYISSVIRATHDEVVSGIESLELQGLIEITSAVVKPSSRRRKAVITPSNGVSEPSKRRPTRRDETRRDETGRDETGRDETDETVRASALGPLADLWNSNCGDLPKIEANQGKRKTHSSARWQEKPDPDFWQSVIARIASSSFCKGENERGWRADFDFLVKPDTYAKVCEGKYDNRKGKGPQKSEHSRTENLDDEIKNLFLGVDHGTS